MTSTTTTENQAKTAQLKEDAVYYEYTRAADPVGSGAISQVPYAEFLSDLHESNQTALIPLDISAALGCAGPATSPALCANFVHILPGENLTTDFNATSQLIYVMRGEGKTSFDGLNIPWQTGDFVVLPVGSEATHYARSR